VIDYCFVTQPEALTPEQIRAIHGLYAAAGWWNSGDPPSPHIDDIIRGSHCFVLALEGGDIVGMGRAISDRCSDAYIQDVTVAESHRQGGIGVSIVKQLIQRLHADGLGWIGVVAESGTREFYENIGFELMKDSAPLLFQDDQHAFPKT